MTDKSVSGRASEEERRHELKTWPPFFEAVARGLKPFEVRKNDRGFQKGDVLILREWDACDGYSGSSVEAEVGYMMEGGHFGLEEGYCILGLTRLQVFPNSWVLEHPND